VLSASSMQHNAPKPPPGFKAWSREDRATWLDLNWPVDRPEMALVERDLNSENWKRHGEDAAINSPTTDELRSLRAPDLAK
jgi:hypothetical protein